MPADLVLHGGEGGELARFGVVTVSDRASASVYEDLSGPAIIQFFHEAIKTRCVGLVVLTKCRNCGLDGSSKFFSQACPVGAFLPMAKTLSLDGGSSRDHLTDCQMNAPPHRRRSTPRPSWEVVYRVIPDERELISQTLRSLCDEEACCFVVTTGGTGPAARDVTPEATEDVRAPTGSGSKCFFRSTVGPFSSFFPDPARCATA